MHKVLQANCDRHESGGKPHLVCLSKALLQGTEKANPRTAWCSTATNMAVSVTRIAAMQSLLRSYPHDGGGDVLGSIDDLFDTRHTQCHIHAGDSSKMESLERHLSAGLTNTLSAKRTHS